MELLKGFIFKDSDKIKESYAIEGNRLVINLSAEKYKKVMADLCNALPEPTFLFLEIPCSEGKEKELRKSSADPFHKDIYYLDGLNYETINLIMEKMGDILINDGLSSFGFGNLEGNGEIMKTSYNVLLVTSNDLSSYIEILNKNNINYVDKIVTVFDLISSENHACCQIYRDEQGKDVYKIKDFLLSVGAYLDKTVEK